MAKKQDKQLLADTQLERAFCCALAVDVFANRIVKELRNVLQDDDFSVSQWRNVWRCVCACADNNVGVSLINIYTQGKAMGIDIDTRTLITTQSTYADNETMGRMLHSLGQRRRLASRVEDVYLTLLYQEDTTTEQAMAELAKAINDTTATSAERIETFGEVYEQLLKVTQDKANGLVAQGVPSGFSLIDGKGGLERGELMIVAGRNSNGKTSLALCMALNAAEQGVPVGIFSLEMTNLQLTTRLTSLITGINGESIKRADMTQDEWGVFANVNDSAPIYFDRQRASDADTLLANIKGMVATKGVQVVVIDYLQLLRGKEQSRHEQLGGIAHRLEALSKQLEICIILLSQLRRNQPNDPVPKLEELKESGDIADAADSIYMVYRPERHGEGLQYPDMSQNWSQYSTRGTALLMCHKNRQGALAGEQMLRFDCETTRFYEGVIPLEAAPLPSTPDNNYNTPF